MTGPQSVVGGFGKERRNAKLHCQHNFTRLKRSKAMVLVVELRVTTIMVKCVFDPNKILLLTCPRQELPREDLGQYYSQRIEK